MRSIILTICLSLVTGIIMAQTVVKLPEPNKNVSMTLYQALQQRKSVRLYSNKLIEDQKLSQLLWAAVGINRTDGRLTAPTTVNAQEISVYVCRQDGAYLYVAKDNILQKVSDKDLRKLVAANQLFAADAPISLVIVADNEKLHDDSTTQPSMWGLIDVGYVSQNIDLACEALGLVTVPRGTMDKESLKKELKLSDKQFPVINHPIAYAK